MKILRILFLFLLCIDWIPAEEIARLTELTHPFRIFMDEQHLYTSEGVDVYIYDRKDWRLVTKFGKEGEGPGEFLLHRESAGGEIKLSVHPKFIVVSTMDKIVYFSKKGEFIREKKTVTAGRFLVPFQDRLVAQTYSRDETKKQLHHGITIYNSDLTPFRKIYSHIHGWQGPEADFNPLTVEPADFDICGDRIFVIDGGRSKILVFDPEGNEKAVITHPGEPVPFTQADKDEIIQEYQLSAFWKRYYESRKKMFKFPEFFPPIRWFRIDPVKRKLYIETEKKKADQRRWLVFDFSGRMLSRLWLSDGGIDTFYDGHRYRLTENEEEEVWVLSASELE